MDWFNFWRKAKSFTFYFSMMRFAILLPFFLLVLFFRPTQEQAPSDMQGFWIRQTDVSMGSLSGIIVYVDSEKGLGTIVQVHENCCFDLGTIKWQNIRSVGENYYLDELWKYGDCTPSGYYPTSVRFVEPDKIELSSGSYTTYWLRLAMDNA